MRVSVQTRGGYEVIASFPDMTDRMHAEMLKTTGTLAALIEAHVKNDKLSGQILNSISGTLKRSIHSDVTDTPDLITGRVFSAGPVAYAGIHEYGGTTKAHIIEAINGQALKFVIGGKMLFRRKVNHPGSKMPERSYLRSSVRDFQEKIIADYVAAAKRAVKP